MDPGHISSDHYGFFVNGFPYPNAFLLASSAAYTNVASRQSPVTLHRNVPRSHLAHGEQVRRPSDSQVTEMTEKNNEHQAAFHRQAMMNAFPAVATPGGNLRPAVSPRQLSPPNYAFVQPSENEHLKRQIEERMKELAQKDEKLKAASKRAALTDAKATSAVASAQEKYQQLIEDTERAKGKTDSLKKELDEKDALIEELSKENDEILRQMQQEQVASTDTAERENEAADEPSTTNVPFAYDAAKNATLEATAADGSSYPAVYSAQPAYMSYNYANYW